MSLQHIIMLPVFCMLHDVRHAGVNNARYNMLYLTYDRWASTCWVTITTFCSAAITILCLWSRRTFPPLPGYRLVVIFCRDASSAVLQQLVKQCWLNFSYSSSPHSCRYGEEARIKITFLTRIELTTSALTCRCTRQVIPTIRPLGRRIVLEYHRSIME